MPFEIFTIQFSTEEPSCSCYAEQQQQHQTLESDQASQQDENPKSQLFQTHCSGLEKLILRIFLRNWIYQETDPLNLPSRVLS